MFFRLAYSGLLQFGPQKLKEKDQVWLMDSSLIIVELFKNADSTVSEDVGIKPRTVLFGDAKKFMMWNAKSRKQWPTKKFISLFFIRVQYTDQPDNWWDGVRYDFPDFK